MTSFVFTYTVIGQTTVAVPTIAFHTALKVNRQGMEYDIIHAGTPTSRQVLVNESTGDLTFLNPFEMGEGALIRGLGEGIEIIYKT